MRDLSTYDEPSNGDELSETVQGTTDYEAYMRLMNDLQEERKARVEIQAECDKLTQQRNFLIGVVRRLDQELGGEFIRAFQELLSEYNHGGNTP